MDTVWMGPEDGPPTHLNYKRAILKSTPREFTIEILAPEKHGSNYSYGVRVCPVSPSVSDSRSISSRSSIFAEYEIWRRWEDCLNFQNTLETEYEQLSRRKVRVLKRGGKKQDTDSIYTQSHAASSFDSLPEGPDPREVVTNVHDIIPPLSKRGTLFRPSRATIEQRGAEFAAMMCGLFNPDPEAPVLLRELRNSQAVRDFFAYWRRDKETAERYGAKMKHSNRSMSSILPPSVHEQVYPPLPSPPSTAPPPTTPLTPLPMTEAARPAEHTSARDSHSDGPPLVAPHASAAKPVNQRQPISSPYHHYHRPSQTKSMTFTDRDFTSGAAASSHSLDPWQRRDSAHNITAINEDMENSSHLPRLPPSHRPPPPPRRFSNADTREPTNLRPRSNSSTVPDHRSVYPREAEPHHALPPVRGQSSHVSLNRNLHSFSSNPSLRERHSDRPPSLKSPSSSNFSQTTSISSRFSNMSLNRSSVNSSISGYTRASKFSQQGEAMYDGDFDHEDDNDSAVHIPSSPLSSHRTPLSNIEEDRPASSHHSYRASVGSIRTEVSADGVLPPHLREAWGIEDEVNSYPPEQNSLSPQLRKSPRRDFNHRYSGSSMSSSSSFSSTGERGDTVAIKAVYHDYIVMFRVDRSSTLRHIQQRVKERLALHEPVPNQVSFVLAYAPNLSSSSTSHRTHGTSGLAQASSDNLRVLQNDSDWQTALSTCNSMIRIRVLDPEAFPHYI